jgi:hypothetical protein
MSLLGTPYRDIQMSHFANDSDRDSFTCPEGHEMHLRKGDPVVRIKRYSADPEMSIGTQI